MVPLPRLRGVYCRWVNGLPAMGEVAKATCSKSIPKCLHGTHCHVLVFACRHHHASRAVAVTSDLGRFASVGPCPTFDQNTEAHTPPPHIHTPTDIRDTSCRNRGHCVQLKCPPGTRRCARGCMDFSQCGPFSHRQDQVAACRPHFVSFAPAVQGANYDQLDRLLGEKAGVVSYLACSQHVTTCVRLCGR